MSKKNSNKTFWIGLAVALGLPLSFYLVAKVLHKDQIVMPAHFGMKGVSPAGDTLWRTTGELQGVNQMNEPVSLNAGLEGKVLAIDAFFIDCTEICPRLSSNMALLQRVFRRTAKQRNDTSVQLISITTQPETDSVPRLREYADSYRANSDHWWFVQASPQATAHYLREELKLTGDAAGEGLMHSPTIVLLDKKRRIRGYYNGLDSAEVRKCADDIVLLTIEKDRPRR